MFWSRVRIDRLQFLVAFFDLDIMLFTQMRYENINWNLWIGMESSWPENIIIVVHHHHPGCASGYLFIIRNIIILYGKSIIFN